MLKSNSILFCLLLSLALQAQTYYVFVGAYVPYAPDQGIRVYTLDTLNGQLQYKSLCPNLLNPAYLNLSPDGRYLYASTEARTPKDGNVSSFAFDSLSGKLTFLNKQKSGGENPVYVNVHRSGKWVLNANYTEASVSVYGVNPDGSLQPASKVFSYAEGSKVNPERQPVAHTHAAIFSPQHDAVWVPDLGADKIRSYRFSPQATQPLTETSANDASSPPGSGPRHLTFHPNQKCAYCIEELSGTVSVYRHKKGRLYAIQNISAHPQELSTGFNSADIHPSPDGRFLYVSNRGDENNLAIFAIHPRKGTLQPVGYQATLGKHPRNFTIDQTGNFLLLGNMLSNSIVVFKRDPQTGLLTKMSTLEGVPSPSCLKIRRYKN
jgi:6-phosphogluconolactonase (cycloisomerase 2 family)